MQARLENYPHHKHPLIYNDDQQEDLCCSACGLPLLLSPSYRCNKDCYFFLHESCTQLPQKLDYVSTKNGLEYSLDLVAKPPNEAWTCDVCDKLCNNLIAYRGIESPEEFGVPELHVDALCAPCPLEIYSKHDSHKHELVAMRREALLMCDVCRRQEKGFFFSCREHCNFSIHKDCAVLPRIIEITHHDQPSAFSYSDIGRKLAWFLREDSRYCTICKDKLFLAAAYTCYACPCYAHPNCALSENKNSDRISACRSASLLEEADKILFIYKMLDKKRIIEKNELEEKLSIKKYHNHPDSILFHDTDPSYKYYSLQCNGCIQPINSPPFYSCEQPGYDFLLHKHCSNLPSEIHFPEFLGSGQTAGLFKANDQHFSLFECWVCDQACSGFGYQFQHAGVDFKSDVGCASLPKRIKHQLHHRKHTLHLIPTIPGSQSQYACCVMAEGEPILIYKCMSCDFIMHNRCALLPAKVSHKFDKHPLHLSSNAGLSTNHVDGSEHCFCEICEDQVDTEYWFYRCTECDQFFHINCITSVGVLSKVKFGSTHVIPMPP